jgi:four helix bundle protein
MAARSFEDLEVWQKAHQLVLLVYKMTAGFPREELFGLTSQLRRAMMSVPANIAEGSVKRGRADKLRFYNIAQGSLEECRYYFRLARDLNYADTTGAAQDIAQVSRMLEAYSSAVRRSALRTWGFLLLTAGFWLAASGFLRGDLCR